jgi:hypothetical protein
MIIEIIVLVVALLIAMLLFWVVKKFLPLIINSILGLAALVALNLMGLHVAINVWSVLIVAIGGLPGLVLVALLHVIGLAF